jgi:hypothetical protein
MPIAAAPTTKAGSSGDSGDDVGQGVGTFIVDTLRVVTVLLATTGGVVSLVISPTIGVSRA